MTKQVYRIISAGLMVFALALAGCGESDKKAAEANHLVRAEAYIEQGQYKAATIEYKNAVKKSEGDVSAIVPYAEMLTKVGQYGSALGMLEQAVGEKSERFYIVKIKAFQGLHKYRSAGRVIEQASNSFASDSLDRLHAFNLLGLEQFKEASAIFDSLLEKSPNDYQSVLGKATALVRQGDLSAGTALLNTIPKEVEAFKKAQILLAGAAINENKLELGEEILTGLLSRMTNTDIMEPEKAVVLERLSYVLTRLGRSNEAYIYTKLLAEAFPGSNEVKERYQGAVSKLKEGKLEEAKSVLADILNEYPSYKMASQLMGVIAYLEGDNNVASKYLSESVDVEVADEITKNIYAATNLKLNDPDKVIEILGADISKSENPKTLALYGLAALSANQKIEGEKALLKSLDIEPQNAQVRLALASFYRSTADRKHLEWEQLSKAYELDPTHLQVLREVVRYHMRTGGESEADKFVKAALNKQPKQLSTNLIAGYMALQHRDLPSALRYFEDAERYGKNDASLVDVLIAKGKVQASLSKFDSAIESFKKVISLSPKGEQGYKGLLSVYSMKNDFEKGQSELEAYAKENALTEPYYVLIRAAIANKDVKAAKEFYAKAQSVDAEHESLGFIGNAIKYVEAVMSMQQNDIDGARSKVAEILSDEPDNIRLLSFMVELELKAGRMTEAKKVLAQIEGVSPEHQVVELLKGDVEMSAKQYELARKHYSQSWNNMPNEAAADKLYFVLGLLKDTASQSNHLSDWLKKMPQSQKALIYRALSYQQRGQRIKAAEVYEQVVKINPNHAIALNNLGWIYFEKGKTERSLELLERAFTLAPNSAAILDSYGWVLFKSGRVEEGRKILKKANQLAPQNEEIASHLREAQG